MTTGADADPSMAGTWALDAAWLTDPGHPNAEIFATAGQPVDLESLRTVPDGPIHAAGRHLMTTPIQDQPLAWTGERELLLIVLTGRVELIRSLHGAEPHVQLLGEGQSMAFPPGHTVAVRTAASAQHAVILRVHADQTGATPRPDVAAGLGEVAHVPDFYYGYAERYAAVYAAGARSWEPEEPNDVLLRALEQLPSPPCSIIDLGCGEGRDAVYLASRGFKVTAIDVARAALDKGRERARSSGVEVAFLERDVVYLNDLPRAGFDVALNMGCLHMIPDAALRAAHLRGVYELLRPGGLFLLAHCRERWLEGFYSVPDYDAVGPVVPGRVVPRRIRLREGGTAMLPLPLVPYKESAADELSQELTAAGLNVEQDLSGHTDAFGNTVVLLARRPG